MTNPKEPETITLAVDTDTLMGQAIGLMRRAYYGMIRDLSQEIIKAIHDDEITDSDALQDRIHEDCDGSQWVIYTFKAQQVLLASDNDGAYADDFGEEGIVKDGAINWSGLAYAAMARDLSEQLDAEGVNLNGQDKNELLNIEDDDSDDDTNGEG